MAYGQVQFDPRDDFLIIEDGKGTPIETQPSQERAKRAIGWLEEHERRNNRPTTYSMVPNPKKVTSK